MADVNVILDNLRSTDTRVGEWLNIIGYVQEPSDQKLRNQKRGQSVRVQVVMLWSAGAIKLDEYERVLAEKLAVERQLGRG